MSSTRLRYRLENLSSRKAEFIWLLFHVRDPDCKLKRLAVKRGSSIISFRLFVYNFSNYYEITAIALNWCYPNKL